MRKTTPVKPGEVLGGKYRIERLLGEGGMGIVLSARHLELHQRVAVKLLQGDALEDPDQKERFLREARAAVRLRSEHVAKVMDVGRTNGGAPYMVMELLEGEDLGQIVARGPLAIGTAVDYVLQACEAIAEAHALGIVHRDLKPRNLYLTRRVTGQPLVKVLDFGLAKHVAQMGDRGLTSTTAIMGSPQYMSPEQMRASRDVDIRTDIWSLGVCLYELLTTQVPFDSPAIPELCALVLTAAPRPIRQLRPQVSNGLALVIGRCLEKDPARRFASVAELAAELEPYAPTSSRGAAERIAAVSTSFPNLSTDPPPSLATEGDTRTAAAFDSAGTKATSNVVLVMAGVAVLAVIGAVSAIAVRIHASAPPPPSAVPTVIAVPEPPPAIPDLPAPPPTGASTVVVPLLTAALPRTTPSAAPVARPSAGRPVGTKPAADAGPANPSSKF